MNEQAAIFEVEARFRKCVTEAKTRFVSTAVRIGHVATLMQSYLAYPQSAHLGSVRLQSYNISVVGKLCPGLTYRLEYTLLGSKMSRICDVNPDFEHFIPHIVLDHESEVAHDS
jgi:hypothetical protein